MFEEADMPISCEDVAASLEKLASEIESQWNSQGKNVTLPMLDSIGWNASPLSMDDVTSHARSIAHRIRRVGKTQFTKDTGAFLGKVNTRAGRINLANWTSDARAVMNSVFDFLIWVDLNLPPEPAQVDWEEVKDKPLIPKDIKRRLRLVESKVSEVEPRAAEVAKKISEIEAAHAAAEQLPADLEDLADLRRTVAETADSIEKTSGQIEGERKRASDAMAVIDAHAARAEKLLELCESTFRASTAKGLASAFEERARSLTKTGWFWVGFLVVALGAGLLVGYDRLDEFRRFLATNEDPDKIWWSGLLSLLSVGGPIWLAWISTRHIGQNFRLAEDYAFKSSVAKAYEGFRREAMDVDPEMAHLLLRSTFARLDEAPIRLLDKAESSSPMQEILENKALREMLALPSSAKEVINKAAEGMGKLASRKITQNPSVPDAE